MFTAMWAILLGLSPNLTHATDRLEQPMHEILHLVTESRDKMNDTNPEADADIKQNLKLAASLVHTYAELSPALRKWPGLRLQLMQMLGDILNHYLWVRVEDAHRLVANILDILDTLQLWSRAQLWFLTDNLASSADINTHAARLGQIIPQLPIEDRRALAAELRKIRPIGLATLCLLQETGLATKGELVRLLATASRQFAKSLGRGRGADDDEFRKYRLSLPYQSFIARKLKDIQAALQVGDPLLASAYDQTVAEIKHNQPTGYVGRDRLLFLVLIYRNQLDWFDRASWVREMAANPNPEPPTLNPRYQVKGNVLVVNFESKRKCARQLEE